MANRENSNDLGMKGGILADDMGLGKTLTVLSLILTNFWDKKPLAKPISGTRRRLSKGVMRYMPHASTTDNSNEHDFMEVGAISRVTRDRKDTKGRAKSSKRRKFGDSNGYVITAKGSHEPDAFDNIELPADTSVGRDEFDDMLGDGNDSLGARLGVDSTTSDLFKVNKRKRFFDDLSDDEEYQNMTEEERDRQMIPTDFGKSQLDGAVTDEDSEDDFYDAVEEPCSSTEDTNKNTMDTEVKLEEKPFVSNNEDSNGVGRSMSPDELDFEIPDIEEINDEDEGNGDTNGLEVEKSKNSHSTGATVQLTEEQLKNLIIPPRQPAKANNRRKATLLVTPASLISHWLGQIEQHVDKSVELSIFVHHGTNRAMLGKELEDHDIVLTTYGTLQAEFNDTMHGPLVSDE